MRSTPLPFQTVLSVRLVLPFVGLLLVATSGYGQAHHGNQASGQAATPPDSTEIQRMEALFWERQQAARARFTEADESFMVGMIAHHSQALIMTELARENNAGEGVMQMARRIENTQIDEIATMQQWLRDRSLAVPIVSIDGIDMQIEMEMPEHTGTGNGHAMVEPGDAVIESETTPRGEHHDSHSEEPPTGMAHGESHDMVHHHMPGMLTRDQLAEMATATGADFDELFLRYMIEHHQGAIYMVQELLAAEGAAQHPETFRLASDINADQEMEIERMKQMLHAMGATQPTSPDAPLRTSEHHEH